MTRWLVALLAAWLMLGACADDDGPAPRIDLLAPPQAGANDTVEILGVRFCGSDPANVTPEGDACVDTVNGFVTFGTAQGIAIDDDDVTWAPERITVKVPGLVAGPTSVTVTVEGRPSNVADFTVIE